MAVSFLTNISEEEFKIFLRQTLSEILRTEKQILSNEPILPDILNVKQAAEYLHFKVSTLYEKTCEKTIPHIKKGNRLYFNKSELQEWLQNGKVKTKEDIQSEAANYRLRKEVKK